jgi:hypothetical protein
MPSQIIPLPAEIFSVLFDHHYEIAAALSPDFFDLTTSAPHAPISIEVWMTRCVFIRHAPSYAMVPALVIVAEGKEFHFWPQPLPENQVRRMLDAIEPALTSVPALTGHQSLEVSEAIERSRQAPATGARPVIPLPAGSVWQQRLLAKAQDLTRKFERELGMLDGKLASYQANHLDADLDRVITRLDAHAHLGQRLRLRRRPDGKLAAELHVESRRGSLAQVIHAAQAQEQAALHAHQHFSPFGYLPDPEVGTLAWLNRLVRDAGPKAKGFEEFRTSDQVISELASKSALSPRVPAEALPQALQAWLDDMQPGRWPEVHPIVHASFALADFMAIQPFPTGNGRLARILYAEALRTRGIPVLASNFAIEREFESYQAALNHAVIAGAYEALVAFMLWAGDVALAQTARMAAVLGPERRKLTSALEHRTFDGVAVGHDTAYGLAEDLIGGVLVEGFSPQLEFVSMRSLLGDLAREGLLDLVATPSGTWASVSSIRELMAIP